MKLKIKEIKKLIKRKKTAMLLGVSYKQYKIYKKTKLTKL